MITTNKYYIAEVEGKGLVGKSTNISDSKTIIFTSNIIDAYPFYEADNAKEIAAFVVYTCGLPSHTSVKVYEVSIGSIPIEQCNAGFYMKF